MSAHMATIESSSSSEDEVENQRLLDSVWDQGLAAKNRPIHREQSDNHTKRRQTTDINKPSVREMLHQESLGQFDEDHKCVKASPELRSFVAKKLAGVLDGRLKMTVSRSHKTFVDGGPAESEEDTFRLFSSSSCAPSLDPPEPPAPVKRKRPRIGRNTKKLSQANNENYSSDSDVEEQRLAEAAISGHQILSFSAFPASTAHNAEETEIISAVSSISKDTDSADSAFATAGKNVEQTEDNSLAESVKGNKPGKPTGSVKRTGNIGTDSVSDSETKDRNVTESCSSGDSVRKKKKKKIQKIADCTRVKTDVTSESEAEVSQKRKSEGNFSDSKRKRKKKKLMRNEDKDSDGINREHCQEQNRQAQVNSVTFSEEKEDSKSSDITVKKKEKEEKYGQGC